eukprot:1046647-Pelagomonas_calceolata.AAC.1
MLLLLLVPSHNIPVRELAPKDIKRTPHGYVNTTKSRYLHAFQVLLQGSEEPWHTDAVPKGNEKVAACMQATAALQGCIMQKPAARVCTHTHTHTHLPESLPLLHRSLAAETT